MVADTVVAEQGDKPGLPLGVAWLRCLTSSPATLGGSGSLHCRIGSSSVVVTDDAEQLASNGNDRRTYGDK